MSRPAAILLRFAVISLAAVLIGCGGSSSADGDNGTSAESRTGLVLGQVILGDADSHAGTIIYCEGSTLVAFTDAEGHFIFDGLPLGHYALAAQHDGYRSRPIGEVELSTEVSRVALPVVALTRTAPQIVSLPSPARGNIAGRATRARGDDHAGIIVTVVGTSVRTVTDDDGNWMIHALEPGEHTVHFTAEGHAPRSVHATVVPDRLTEVPPVVLGGAAATAGGEEARRIVGFVALLGAAGELVEDYRDVLVVLEGTDHVVAPGADGGFLFGDLPPGIYHLSARAQGYRPDPATRVDLTQPRTVEATVFLESLDAEHPETGRIIGTVELAESANSRGATVGVAGTSRTAITDTSGRFAIEEIPVGSVIVVAQADGYEVLEVLNVEIVAGETTDVGTLRLEVHHEPPRVIATEPADGTRQVLLEPDIPVFIRFSMDMDVASVRQALSVTPDVPFTAHMGREHSQSDFDLLLLTLPGGEGGVDFRQRVRIRISTDARSAGGVAMEDPFAMDFTMGEPALYNSVPPDGGVHPFDQTIRLLFNAPLRLDEIETAFSFLPRPPTVPHARAERDPVTGWTTVFIDVRLAPDERYTLRIARTLRTESGQRVGEPRRIQFETTPDIVYDYYGDPTPRDVVY